MSKYDSAESDVLHSLEKYKIDHNGKNPQAHKMAKIAYLLDEIRDKHKKMVNRITKVADDITFDKFNSKDSMVWFGLFGRFINTGLDDEKFVEFVAEFSQSLHSKKVNDISYDDIVENSKSTKDKSVIVSKIETLEHLMKEYFDIEENDSEVIYDGIGCDAANSEIENLDIVNDGKEDIKSLEDEVNSESVMDVNVKANGEDINAGLRNMLDKWDQGELEFTPTCPRSTYNMQIKAMTDYIAVLEARAIIEGITL